MDSSFWFDKKMGWSIVHVHYDGSQVIHFQIKIVLLSLKIILCLRKVKTLISIGYSMFFVGYGIYTRERSSRVYIS